MRTRWLRVTTTIVVMIPLLAAVAGVSLVRAQNDAEATGLALPIFGELDGQEGTFQGTVSSLKFVTDGQTLTLTGLLNGLAGIGDDSVRVTDQEFETPVEPSVAGATVAEEGGQSALAPGGVRAYIQDNPTQPEPDEGKCDVLYLDIQPITLNLLGLEVLTSRITVDANAIPGEGNLAGNLICSLAGLLDGMPDTIGQVTDELNQIVSEGGAAQTADGLGSLPLFGTFEDANGETGTFQGTVSDVVFSEDGGTILDGVLNGIVTRGGTATRVVDQPITSPVTPSVVGSIPADQFGNGRGNGNGNGANQQPTAPSTDPNNPTQPEPDPDKCDVLYLDIQPITLNLLGLEVLTSRITVDVNAIPGEGNLAGNLVCALAGLLDGTPDAIGEITDQLNNIVNEIGVAPASAESADAEATGTIEAADVAPDATEAAGAAPTQPAAEPTVAAEPTQPAAEPTVPPAEPTVPPAEPTVPPAEPTVPPVEPTPAA